MQSLRVGVLMGGFSIEREVSFNSGRTVCDHLDTTHYQVIPIFQRLDGALFILPYKFLHRGKIDDFVDRLDDEAQQIAWDDVSTHIDFMYIATHGRYAEDGILQGTLEVLNIPYLGSKIYASALSMDKITQKKILQANNIDIPHSISLTPQEVLTYTSDALVAHVQTAGITFPCIVKPYKEGSSFGVQMVHDSTQLHHALEYACYIFEKPQSVLVEEYIVGMEFSCIVLMNNQTGDYMPLPPTEIIPEHNTYFFDYEQKYMPGRAYKHTPARCGAEIISAIQTTCVNTMKALDITTIARIDGFVRTDGSIVIIDPNTLSGMGPASFLFREAAELNMGHAQVINHLIETELKAYNIISQAHSLVTNETMATHKIRIAVLLGGDSHEKEISLESGRNIIYKLAPHRYEVVPLFVDEEMKLFHINQTILVRNSTKEIKELLDNRHHIRWHDLPQLVDFVFIALHGGKGENGAVQGMLEMLKLPYNGSSVLASALCMDKYKLTELLALHDIAVPRHILIHKDEWHANQNTLIQTIIQTIGLPVIIKPHDDGCSVFVTKCITQEALSASIQSLFDNGKNYAFIEECISGMELTVGVIGNNNPHALPPSQTVTSADILSITEKFLPGAGHNITPAPLSDTTRLYIQHTMEQAYKAAGCVGYARIDCFYQSAEQSPTKKERVIVLEINTLPGMTPATCIFHQAAELGISPMEFIDLIVQLGFAQHSPIAHQSTHIAIANHHLFDLVR